MEPLSGRKSLTDEVHDRLVDALCSGALPPGTPLRQEAIAEELNVSRQPVLQALGLLRRDGLVEPMGGAATAFPKWMPIWSVTFMTCEKPLTGSRPVLRLNPWILTGNRLCGLPYNRDTTLWAAATPQTLLQPMSHSIKRSTAFRVIPYCPRHLQPSGCKSGVLCMPIFRADRPEIRSGRNMKPSPTQSAPAMATVPNSLPLIIATMPSTA